MLGLTASGLVHKHVFTVGMIVFVTGLGVFLPTAVAAALTPFPGIAGSAAAMLGFLQMAGDALGTVAVSALSGATPLFAFPLVMAVSSLFAASWFTGAPERHSPTSPVYDLTWQGCWCHSHSYAVGASSAAGG